MRIITVDDWWEGAERFIESSEAMIWVSLYVSPESLKEALEKQDEVLIRKLLNKVWWRLPDDRAIQRLRHFNLMCDLCSEDDLE